MSDKHFDKLIHQSLSHKNSYSDAEKDQLWNSIQLRLHEPSQTHMRSSSSKKNKQRIALLVASLTAILIALGSFTETGHAIMNQIQKWFPSEKKVTQTLEGMEEKKVLQREEGSKSEYVLYVDPEYYQIIHGETEDIIQPKEPLPKEYPEVSMTITQQKDQSPEEVVKAISSKLKTKYQVRSAEPVTEPVEGWRIYASAGQKWNSPVVQVYITTNGQKGSFIITQKYFLEASEGHGARFYHMLKEFHVAQPK